MKIDKWIKREGIGNAVDFSSRVWQREMKIKQKR